ncbi:arylsulfatase-like isoform X3 [Apostichopus japonicus]|uniref:arylsulfatase-like isoform X3 n=1 Tax=Stichopus japonicus TaxID=307972 RepID=UPI003AB7205B
MATQVQFSLHIFSFLIAILLTSSTIAQDQPNIILFLADDVGYGDLSCYGHPSQVPGGIDQLAKDGKRFTAAYVPDPNGVASRGAILTGRLPVRIGLYGLDGEDRHTFTATHSTGLPKTETTIAEALKEHGYATGMVGKWNLGINEETATDGSHLPKNHGFDYVGYNLPLTNSWGCGLRSSDPGGGTNSDNCFLYKNDVIVEQPFDPSGLMTKFLGNAEEFIREHKEEPFFLYFAFSNNHVTLSPSDQFSDTSPLGTYGDSTNEMNSAVTDVMDLLNDLGLRENTLVIFLSDNGPFLEMCSKAGFEGPLKGGKSTVYEGGIRIPFIVSWPGQIPAGSVSRHTVSSMDIFPTILDVIGRALPTGITYDGSSLKSILYEEFLMSEKWGFEIQSQMAPAHPEGLYFYSGEILTAMRFDGYKVHFRLQPQPLTTRVGFGEECTEGAPLMEYYAGCREPTCFTTQQVPTVYLIDADVGEGFRFTNYSEIAVFDPGFECKMMQLNFAHASSIVRGPDLLSSTNQIAELQPCCTLPGCPSASSGVRASIGKPAYVIVCSVAIRL